MLRSPTAHWKLHLTCRRKIDYRYLLVSLEGLYQSPHSLKRWQEKMVRYFSLICLLVPCFLGCGGQTEQAANQASVSPSEEAESNALVNSPTDVVSQFLDEVRRGGEDSLAESLLTLTAQSELRRIGQTVQPIGSPDASFKVTRAEMVPDEPGSALVHSLWVEPNPDGTQTTNQVVWAVEQEGRYWRISGLVIAIEENQPPMVLDFENGDMMARLLAGETADTNPPNSGSSDEVQAAAGNTSVNR